MFKKKSLMFIMNKLYFSQAYFF